MNIIEKRIEFSPAFDKRDADPSKNYGIHGVSMTWLLITDRGACQFVVYTGWHLPHVQAELSRKRGDNPHTYIQRVDAPMPADIGYHSPTPQYEDQPEMECHLLEGGKCYYDGSGLQAQDFYDTLVLEGHEAVWKKMEGWFQDIYDANGEEDE